MVACGHAFGESHGKECVRVCVCVCVCMCARLWPCVCFDKPRLVSQCLQGPLSSAPTLILIPFQTLTWAALNPRLN